MATPERRVDPHDGNAYTFPQVFAFYAQLAYAPWQIEAYWAAMQPAEKPEFRFEQGDQVVCNVGDRWLPGKVLSRDVEDPEDPSEDNFAYVVKTDAIQGACESRTISAPDDDDDVICRDRCFHVEFEAFWTKWAAPIMDRKPSLRFGLGDEVGIRVKDKPDGTEQWIQGEVVEIWPALPESVQSGFLKTADAVPYKILVATVGTFYCHRDEHTLIRLPQNMPKVPVKSISKRFENRELPDGRVERFDHLTLRSRIIDTCDDDD